MERLKQILPQGSSLRSRRDSVHPPKESMGYNKALPSLPLPELRAKPEAKISGAPTRISKPTLNLLDLPNEILLQITQNLLVNYLPPLQQNRFDGKERIIFVQRAITLINLSLTSKKLHPIAQEVLLHTVVLGGFDGLPSIVSLVRFLLRRPEMGRHVKKLRLGLPPNKIHYFQDAKAKKDGRTSSMVFGSPPRDIENAAGRIISTSPLSEKAKSIWRKELGLNYARPLCGILLCLTVQLEEFSISHSLGTINQEDMRRMMFGLGRVDVDLWLVPGLQASRFGREEGQKSETAKVGGLMMEKMDERPHEARGIRV